VSKPSAPFKFPREKLLFDHLVENLDPGKYTVEYDVFGGVSQIKVIFKGNPTVLTITFEPEGQIKQEFFPQLDEKIKDYLSELVDRCPQIDPEDAHFYEEMLVTPHPEDPLPKE